MVKYNIFFVPTPLDRKKISDLRSRICKKVHSTQALQYPVHMSLISSGFKVKNYSFLLQSLNKLCHKIKPLKVQIKPTTQVLPNRFWTGITIVRTKELTTLQKKLQALRNQFAPEREKLEYHPLHITLAFPAKVDELKIVKCPIKSMKLDRITLVKKERDQTPYKIIKHIKVSNSSQIS